MTSQETEAQPPYRHDKQLQTVSIAVVMEKRRLNQALNVKEFAISAGISYSKAREWFHRQGFPSLEGLVFWQDFLQWKAQQTGSVAAPLSQDHRIHMAPITNLPLRAMQILRDL